jgi:hypothetical protein
VIAHLASGHGGEGYAIMWLSRWMYHQIGWWSVPVTAVAVLMFFWVRDWFSQMFP